MGLIFSPPPPRLSRRKHISNASVVRFRDNKYRRIRARWKEEKGSSSKIQLLRWPTCKNFPNAALSAAAHANQDFRISTYHGNYEVVRTFFAFFFFFTLATPAPVLSLFHPPPFSLTAAVPSFSRASLPPFRPGTCSGIARDTIRSLTAWNNNYYPAGRALGDRTGYPTGGGRGGEGGKREVNEWMIFYTAEQSAWKLINRSSPGTLFPRTVRNRWWSQRKVIDRGNISRQKWSTLWIVKKANGGS